MKKKVFSLTAFLLVIAAPTFSSAEMPLAAVLDAGSAECVSCHHDSITVNEPLQVCHKGDCEHPVGVSYVSFSARNKGLVPPEGLDPAIKLIDGKMGCLACHTPYVASDHETAAGSMLSVDNTGSGLCVACHRK